MKKLSLLLLVLFVNSFLYAGEALTVVKGSITKENVRSVILYSVFEGKKTEFASTKVRNAEFAFALPVVEEGYYYISDQRRASFTRIYLKPNDQLELMINSDGYEVLKGSKENKMLHKWFTVASVITQPAFNWMDDSSTYKSYFPKMEAFMPVHAAFKKKMKTSNPQFDALFSISVDMDIEHAAMKFLLAPNTVHPKREEYPAFYNTIVQPTKFPSALFLQSGDAVDIISLYMTFQYIINRPEGKPENRLLSNCNLIANDTIKGAYVANSLNYKTYEALEKDIAAVKQYLVTDSMQVAYFHALKSVAGFKKGSVAYNFTVEDMNGKKVSMQDLKGKVILIDMWATWCGPCKVEIPYLKTLEKEFEGKNIEFVSISVDVEKDKEKWKNMVLKEELGGTQLFASGWSAITKYYDITGIPRFMLFDTEGKIVTVDAPRPSNPELKVLLQNTLEGK
jgi:thiol-disulfide isomerase/thioredoxin